jgi:hypothetical protein
MAYVKEKEERLQLRLLRTSKKPMCIVKQKK